MAWVHVILVALVAVRAPSRFGWFPWRNAQNVSKVDWETTVENRDAWMNHGSQLYEKLSTPYDSMTITTFDGQLYAIFVRPNAVRSVFSSWD